MKSIKFIKLFFIVTILLILTIGTFNFIIDPFQQYRKAVFHKTIFMKEFYLHAGLIKNYNYDSLVLGSSMTQNFIISEVNEYLDYNETLKLPIYGGNSIEQHTLLDSAINSKKIKNVLFGLDIFTLENSINRLPTYLYDNDLSNDYLYLLNIDTLKRSLLYPLLHLTLSKTDARLNYNLMFQWQHRNSESDFNAKKVLNNMLSKPINLGADVNQELLMQKRITNFEKYLLPLIKDNPDIKYTIFYPPYSILTYKTMEKDKSLEHFILMKKYIFEKLVKHKNVKLFDFQTAKDISHNLNNYKDITHYHQKINTWMLGEIQNSNFLLTEDNIEHALSDFYNQITEYNLREVVN